jgi:tRNA-dihydrouridine synthase A
MVRTLLNNKELSVAPMMAWTDRHCRYLHRLVSSRAMLFTEMITSGALLNGPAERLLRFDPSEHPVAIQLGGSEPSAMAEAARMAAAAGFDEININVGCPSPRVQRGAFGACLMREPELVAALVDAMHAATEIPVTVKCRLGVDDDDSQEQLESFVTTVASAGCRRFYVHARKALLNGLSPAENRTVPPLEYERVYALKARHPELTIVINGGIDDADEALAHLARVDGLMIGRRAYQAPLFLNMLAHRLYDEPLLDACEVMGVYTDYMARELKSGTRLADMTRHCLGLFAGMPGARHFRRLLSDHRRLKRNDLSLVKEAMDQLERSAA